MRDSAQNSVLEKMENIENMERIGAASRHHLNKAATLQQHQGAGDKKFTQLVNAVSIGKEGVAIQVEDSIGKYIALPLLFLLLFQALASRPESLVVDQTESRLPNLTSLCDSAKDPNCFHLGLTYFETPRPKTETQTEFDDRKAQAAVIKLGDDLTRLVTELEGQVPSVKLFPDIEAMEVFLMDEGNRFGVGLSFRNPDQILGGVNYLVHGKHSVLVKYGAVAQSYVDHVLLTTAHSQNPTLMPQLFAPPRPYLNASLNPVINNSTRPPTNSGIYILGMPFAQRNLTTLYILLSSISILPIALLLLSDLGSHITEERTNSLRLVMEVMGLSSSVHMAALLLAYIPITLLFAILVTVFSIVAKTLAVTSPIFLFVLMVTGFLAMLPLAVLIAIRMQDPTGPQAVSALLLFVMAISVKDAVVSGDTFGLATLQNVFPPALLSRIYGLTIERDLAGSPLTLSDPLFTTYLWKLATQAIVCLILAFYLDRVVPGGNYASLRKPWFFLEARSWRSGPNENEGIDLSRQKIVVEDLHKTFWVLPKEDDRESIPVHALDGFSVELEGGQTVALLGHNGAGKSTFLSVLCGATRPHKGDIRIGPLSIRDPFQFSLIHRELGYCPQQHALLSSLTALEHLELFAAIRGVTVYNTDWDGSGGDQANLREYLVSILERLDLGGKVDEVVGSFSGGMKRKMNLAIAMIGEPKVMVLDGEFFHSWVVERGCRGWVLLR
ncbi:ATP-binding cassette sub- A member 12 [Quaeritorhiza haematococci]|nr:ATP-binding cassette sub- A member 12 [Quaeritorhiza haematococci]